MHLLHNSKTAGLKVESSAQTTFRFSPVSFDVPNLIFGRQGRMSGALKSPNLVLGLRNFILKALSVKKKFFLF